MTLYVIISVSEESKVPIPPSVTLEDLSTIEQVKLKVFLTSIVCMPRHMWMLCFTNLLCWMALVTYSLNFTNFVGESIYKGTVY